jgi:hypothetical protein
MMRYTYIGYCSHCGTEKRVTTTDATLSTETCCMWGRCNGVVRLHQHLVSEVTTPGRCIHCKEKFAIELCPLPTFNCACKGDYCRLLGRNPLDDVACKKCRTVSEEPENVHSR